MKSSKSKVLGKVITLVHGNLKVSLMKTVIWPCMPTRLHWSIDCFHSLGQQLCKFLGTKNVCTWEKNSIPQDFFGKPTWRPFIVFHTNMTVVTLCRNDLFLMLFEERSLLVSLCLHWVFLKVILKSENLNEINKFSQAKRQSARRLIVYLKQ